MLRGQWGLASRGQLAAAIDAEDRHIRQVVTRSARKSTFRLRRALASQTAQALKPRMGRTWTVEMFPKGRDSARAAGLVYSKAPDIIKAHAKGAAIRAGGGKWLAIPTGFNRQGGRRQSKAQRAQGAFAGVKVTPAQMVASGKAFVLDRGKGVKIWMLQVAENRITNARGRTKKQAIAGGLVAVGGGRAGRVRDLLKSGAVPMFVLLKEAKLSRRLDPDREADKAFADFIREVAAGLA